MARHLMLCLALTLLAGGLGCDGGSSPSEPTARATLRGIVVNKITGERVGGVTVTTVDSTPNSVVTTSTAADGSFTIGNLQPGLVQVTLARTGFLTESTFLTLEAGESVRTLEISPADS